jgi:uncharacterized protein (UPF0218 family)
MKKFKNFIVPNGVKEEFRKIWGKLYSSLEEAKIPPSKKIIAVGDVVSYNLIKAGIKPSIIVYDGKVERRKAPDEVIGILEKYGEKSYKVKNPPSHITSELQEIVEKSLKEKVKVGIFVDGEEDLAVLPFLLEAEEGNVILYGFPFKEKGVVVLEVNENWKKKGKDLLKKLKVLE